MALFVIILLGVVVAQTWFDWREARRTWVVPEWAKGMALGAVIAVPLAAATTLASIWFRDDAGSQWTDLFGSRVLWPEILFVLCAMGIIVFAARKKWLRLMILLAGVLVAAFWVSMTL